MEKISFHSSTSKQVLDVTETLNHYLSNTATKGDGLCHLFIKHTTAAISTADLDPGTDLDMLDAFDNLIPKLEFRHPHNPQHVSDHIMATLIGTSLTVPFQHKKLLLGTWQRVVIFEFDGPRTREVLVNII